MSECLHKNLALIKEISNKLRCTVCHLTLASEELENDYCPECYESTGKKQTGFEKLILDHGNISRYRCEDCGIIIKSG